MSAPSDRSTRTAGWRLALRIGRRDALRAKGRSALVLAMIALPVLAVTLALVAQRTADVSTPEGLDRTMGAAAARVTVDPSYPHAVLQDPTGRNSGSFDDTVEVDQPSADDLAAQLDAPVTEVVDTYFPAQTDGGAVQVTGLEADLASPLTDGLVDLVSGRLPRDAGEVVVNQALLDEGYAVGDRLLAKDATDGPVVVGVAESPSLRTSAFAAGPVGSLPVDDSTTVRSYLVGGGPVSWATVRELNAQGASVLSRAVVLDPPPDSEVPPEVRGFDSGSDTTTVTVAVLVVTMALLEVVLLAGPAFAVGARRLQRSLALMAAAGATPRQARRVVLAGALVLGTVAAVLGVALGVLLALVVVPVLQHFSDGPFGPFEVPVLPVLVVAAFGLLSALLAAVVPARLASRQDVVAVLAGRRGDPRPSYRSPLLGGVLIGLGIAASIFGATGGSGEVLIAGGALLSVLGMVLVVPVVVSLVAGLSSRLPLSLRYAARDAARHRTRTAPAVAAVAATVAGVVALLIANTSDGAENEATYTPSFAMGVGVLGLYGEADPTELDSLTATLRREVPDATLTPVRGVPESYASGAEAYTYRTIMLAGSADAYERPLLAGTSNTFGASLLVGDTMPPGVAGLSAADYATADAALAAGRSVVLTDRDPASLAAEQVSLRSETTDSGVGATTDTTDTPLTATFVRVSSSGYGPAAVLSTADAARAGVDVEQVGVVVDGTSISEDAQQAVQEAVAAGGADAGFQVERGYQAEDETLVLQLVLVGLGAVLMLGGTLTATFLALSDARPDLATLAAIGASPRRRRGVAAGYALVVGFVGALLGAAVGFVPGIAIAFPLTSSSGTFTIEGSGSVSGTPPDTGPYLDVPWLFVLALVVALPLLTAAIVAACTRSRLPMVARID